MNLWIRSQKDNDNIRPILLKVESLELGDNYDDMNCIVANNLYNIGTYKTKERALEVLEEIQNILLPKYSIRIDGNIQDVVNFLNLSGAYISVKNNGDVRNINNTYVYEMPKE